MKSFEGKLAVVTGGGNGIGRELVIQLAAEGCSVATCDIDEAAAAATGELARSSAPDSVRITTHRCDVSDEAQVAQFRDEVVAQHETDHIHLLVNNAGIGGGQSFVTGSREEWDRTFRVCWGGVYNGARAFVPLLVASDEGCIVNLSSANGFWASVGLGFPSTAYSAAKFAVKGFSEALLEDFRLHAPHVRVAVVMPGHVGTEILRNSRRAHGASEPEDMTPEEIEEVRERIAATGVPADRLTDDVVRSNVRAWLDGFRDSAPLSPADAATTILDGVRAGTWRILVGDDARALDAAVRADPVAVYEADAAGVAAIIGAPDPLGGLRGAGREP